MLEGFHGAVAGAFIDDYFDEQPPELLTDLDGLVWEDSDGDVYEVEIGEIQVLEYIVD